jgi:hypothetical protein
MSIEIWFVFKRLGVLVATKDRGANQAKMFVASMEEMIKSRFVRAPIGLTSLNLLAIPVDYTVAMANECIC